MRKSKYSSTIWASQETHNHSSGDTPQTSCRFDQLVSTAKHESSFALAAWTLNALVLDGTGFETWKHLCVFSGSSRLGKCWFMQSLLRVLREDYASVLTILKIIVIVDNSPVFVFFPHFWTKDWFWGCFGSSSPEICLMDSAFSFASVCFCVRILVCYKNISWPWHFFPHSCPRNFDFDFRRFFHEFQLLVSEIGVLRPFVMKDRITSSRKRSFQDFGGVFFFCPEQELHRDTETRFF